MRRSASSSPAARSRWPPSSVGWPLAEVEALKTDIAEAEKAEAKAATSVSTESTDKRTPKERLQDEARELDLDPEGTVDDLKARIAEARASN
jgi:hypothetical protein